MVSLKAILPSETPSALLNTLSELLIDAVQGGASVGFLSPLPLESANSYWQGVFEALGEGLALWVAFEGERAVGSVQLSLCLKQNGLHRAEVQKLFVHSDYRGQRIASRLLDTLERFAYANGRTLLVLDTEAGSHAESVYRHLGWVKMGEIPRYALNANGVMHATAYYYKEIGTPTK